MSTEDTLKQVLFPHSQCILRLGANDTPNNIAKHNDTKHNGTRHNDTRHNDAQHNNKNATINITSLPFRVSFMLSVSIRLFYADSRLC
jgi:hypothetical protein